MNAATKLTKMIECQNIDGLKALATKLMTTIEDGSEIVMNKVMDVLMERMEESAFVSFCGELESL